MHLDLGERNDFGIARRHGHEGKNAHLVDVVFVAQAERRHKVRIGRVEFQVVLGGGKVQKQLVMIKKKIRSQLHHSISPACLDPFIRFTLPNL